MNEDIIKAESELYRLVELQAAHAAEHQKIGEVIQQRRGQLQKLRADQKAATCDKPCGDCEPGTCAKTATSQPQGN